MINLHLPVTEQVLCYLGTFLGIYILLVGLGRMLKRRAGLRLGLAFQLLAFVLAAYLPFEIFHYYPSFEVIQALRAASILLGSIFILALVRRYIWEGYFETKRQIVIPKLLRDIVAIAVFVLCLVLVLTLVYRQEGKALTGLLAGSGIAAIVLGFAMQDLLGNIISGISLQISRSFVEGDWLKIDNQFAEVMEVNWRSTRLRTNDHIFLELPNSYHQEHDREPKLPHPRVCDADALGDRLQCPSQCGQRGLAAGFCRGSRSAAQSTDQGLPS